MRRVPDGLRPDHPVPENKGVDAVVNPVERRIGGPLEEQHIALEDLVFQVPYRVGQVVIGKPHKIPWWRSLIFREKSVAEQLIFRAEGVTIVFGPIKILRSSRAARRNGFSPGGRGVYIGFRVAFSLD